MTSRVELGVLAVQPHNAALSQSAVALAARSERAAAVLIDVHSCLTHSKFTMVHLFCCGSLRDHGNHCEGNNRAGFPVSESSQ